MWLSIDGTTYSKIGEVDEICSLGTLYAALPATNDPDITDTLYVDMTISGAELIAATQSVADAFGTLCALISPDGNTIEFISYENVALDGPNRYKLTYLRRGVYSSPISAFPMGSTLVYIGSQDIFSYTFGLQYLFQTVYMKFPAFNTTRSFLQPLNQCKAWPVTVGLTGVAVDELYVPSTNTPTLDAYGVLTSPTAAYDKDFATGATLTETVPGLHNGSSSVLFAGFPVTTITEEMGLHITYKGMAGGSSFGTGPNLLVQVSLDGGSTFFNVGGQTYGSHSPSEGTLVTPLPSGQNLSLVQVLVTAGTSGLSGGTAGVEIVECWIQ